MIRSLRTGVSGLKSNQLRMDVVGNNVANVNTVAFKRSRVAFNEVLGQQLLGVGRTAGGAGVNPSFVGLGVSVGSIDQNWAQGALENTGVSTDLALSGDGFFVARAGDRNLLTRAGNFTFNRDGELVTSNGLRVQGWRFDNDQVVTGAPTDVAININAQAPAKYTESTAFAGNLSADTAVGTTAEPVAYSVYDEQGSIHKAVLNFTKTAENEWAYEVSYGGTETTPPFAPITGTITFNTDGTLNEASATQLAWDPAYVAADPNTIDLDFSKLTQYSGSTTAGFVDQDGYSSGSLEGYSITPDGIVQLNFSNGQQQKLFQLAIANVNNPNGLEQEGENMYSTGAASGEVQMGRAGRELRTSVVAGTLEMSNVDLATEFTDMIVAQRGYQAAARLITTSDELLQETVQLKR